MPRRPTLADVAAAAGVSIATVNRAVAGQANVRPATSRRIAEAAARIGYGGVAALNPVADLRLGFVLHKPGQAFYRAMAGEIAAQAAALPNLRIQCDVAFAPSQAPDDMAAALRGMQARAIAATGVNHAATARAVADLRQAGVPVVALLSDFAQGARLSYVG